MRTPLALLVVAASLAACADESRREFIYKPAYCLASGLANMGGDDCLPTLLKEKAAAVATARLKDAGAETPAQALRVYYTDAQRQAISYDIARHLFAPDDALTKSSAITSLEAAGVIEPRDVARKICDADSSRKAVIGFVRARITPHDINRDTADFLGENYTDLQLTELYRVAKAGGSMGQVADDAFILPDPKQPEKNINVKPKNDQALGSIISFTTSRVASRVVAEHRAAIEALQQETRARDCAPPPPPATVEPAMPAAQAKEVSEAPPAPTKEPKKREVRDAAF